MIQPASTRLCVFRLHLFGAYLFDIQHLGTHALGHQHHEIKLFLPSMAFVLVWLFKKSLHVRLGFYILRTYPMAFHAFSMGPRFIYDYKIRFGQLLIYVYRVSIKRCEHVISRKLCALSMRCVVCGETRVFMLLLLLLSLLMLEAIMVLVAPVHRIFCFLSKQNITMCTLACVQFAWKVHSQIKCDAFQHEFDIIIIISCLANSIFQLFSPHRSFLPK